MGIIEFIIIACIIGFVVWLVQSYAPIPGPFKTIILWAGVLVVLVLLLRALGILPGTDWAIPRIR